MLTSTVADSSFTTAVDVEEGLTTWVSVNTARSLMMVCGTEGETSIDSLVWRTVCVGTIVIDVEGSTRTDDFGEADEVFGLGLGLGLRVGLGLFEWPDVFGGGALGVFDAGGDLGLASLGCAGMDCYKIVQIMSYFLNFGFGIC